MRRALLSLLAAGAVAGSASAASAVWVQQCPGQLPPGGFHTTVDFCVDVKVLEGGDVVTTGHYVVYCVDGPVGCSTKAGRTGVTNTAGQLCLVVENQVVACV